MPPCYVTRMEAALPPNILTGDLHRARLASLPGWAVLEDDGRDAPAFDAQAARALATVAPGADVVVVLGTWCGDSRRELPRLWRALDLAGAVPFALRYIGVDRDKTAPGFDRAALRIERVPTFVVSRGGREVGRIVERAPDGLERELLALLQR
jgi:hypothetical protein